MTTPLARARGLADLVRANADEAERIRHLPAVVAEAFAREGLYRVAAPTWCGGEAADPMTQIQVIEAVSHFDGSAGWNLMIGIETFGLVAPGLEACAELIADPRVILCSSTAAVGHAEAVDGGYRVTGQWQFVSGCHNSDAFGATVRLHRDGVPLPDVGNVYAMVPRDELSILDTWHVAGLAGSGSHDVRLDDVFVPDARIVPPLGAELGRIARAHQDSDPDDAALLRFPLGARLAYNKVAVALGIARAALTAFTELAAGKVPRFTSKSLRERPRAQRAVAEAEVRVLGARALVLSLVTDLWQQVRAQRHPAARDLAIFQAACSDAVAGACEAVDRLADAAGTTANMIGHPLERLIRDVRVVRQHTTVASHQLDDAGRVLLGLPGEGLMLRTLQTER